MLGTYALSAGFYDAYDLKAQRVRASCWPATTVGHLQQVGIVAHAHQFHPRPGSSKEEFQRSAFHV